MISELILGVVWENELDLFNWYSIWLSPRGFHLEWPHHLNFTFTSQFNLPFPITPIRTHFILLLCDHGFPPEMQFSQMPSTFERESSSHNMLVSRLLDSVILFWPRRHIFCLKCAGDLGLSHPTAGDRHCPACQTVLSNPDDAVSTVLNPTEDYKTSVLSGLDPNTIMECAGRALGFWAYQSTQEMCVVFE